MANFHLEAPGLVIATGSTYLNILGLKLPNTAGLRARLVRILIGATGATVSAQMRFRLMRSDNTGDGTYTSIISHIAKGDPLSLASAVTVAGINYSGGAPTTLETGAIGNGATGTGGVLVLTPGVAIWGPNQTLFLQGQHSDGGTLNFDAWIEWAEGF
jgi:hypothetical protein